MLLARIYDCLPLLCPRCGQAARKRALNFLSAVSVLSDKAF